MQVSNEYFLLQHDLRIVLLAALVCALASSAGIGLSERARNTQGRRRLIWAASAAISVGFGIWSTHFIAMLSFDPGFALAYAPGETAASLFIAVLFTGLALAMSSYGSRRRWLWSAGLTIGAGVAAMHYTGMAAVITGGRIVWSPELVLLSVASGAALSAVAFAVGISSGGRRARLGASLLLTLAICATHFIAMAAADFGNCVAAVGVEGVATEGLVAAVAAVSAILLGVALLARFIDARDERRTLLEGARLRSLADVAVEGLLISVGGRVVSSNSSFCDLVGASRQEVEQASLEHFVSGDILARMRVGPNQVVSGTIHDASGAEMPVEMVLRTLDLAEGSAEVVAFRDVRQRLQVEKEREAAAATAIEAERRFRWLIQSITDHAIYLLHPDGRVANWNAGAKRNKGYDASEIVGRHYSIFFAEEDRQAGLPELALERALAEGKLEAEGWRYRKDGSRFWAAVVIEPVRDDEGNLVGFAKITRDETRARQDALRVSEARRRLDLALQNMTHGLALFDDDGKLLLANARLGEILRAGGLDLTDLERETTFDKLTEQISLCSGGEASIAHHGERLRQRPTASCAEIELSHELRDGRIVHIRHRAVDEGGWVTTFEDISEKRRSQAQIEHMAQHDNLTALPNRAKFAAQISRALEKVAREQGTRLAVLGIDLDRFKDINDHFGHSTGDQVLKALAARLAETLGDGEFLARIGGDEFSAFVPFRTDHELSSFIGRLQSAISERLVVDQNVFAVGASIGVAVYPNDGMTAEQLIPNADMAMYRAKSSLAEAVCFYEPQMDEAARARRNLARELWLALDDGQLELNYQVQAEVATGEMTGYEVLLRWNHPQLGRVSPAVFIPIAEECGAILPIGEWVLRSACREAAAWSGGERIAVNLSPVQLGQVNLVELLQDILLETRLDPQRLELEVTETSIIADRERALRTLRRVKELGVTVAIDDFGTGYSSLETLRAFPFDKIKLDRSFIGDLEESSQSRAILRAVLALGRSLDVPVLAEGVETLAQLERLKSEGCDEAQGFYLGRPVPSDQLSTRRGNRAEAAGG